MEAALSTDPFAEHAASLTSPPARAFAVTPNDDIDLTVATRAIMVAAPGDVAVTTIAGDDAILPGLQPGVQYAIRARRVRATGTSASGLVGLA